MIADRSRLVGAHLVKRRALGAALAGVPLLLGGGCTPAGVLNALAPDRRVAASLAYAGGPRHRLDVYAPDRGAEDRRPEDRRPEDRRPDDRSAAGGSGHPVVLFLYGGSWDSGSKEMYRFVGGALAAHGFVVVIPDYRLYPEVRYPSFLEDCAAALAWTRRHARAFGGNGAPPFLLGHSAGAYNAAMLALDPRWLGQVGLSPRSDLGGMVGLAGPYDFLPLDSDELRDIFAPGQPLRTTQPIAHVDGRNPPILLLAGRDDRVVQPANSTRLASRIRQAGGIAAARLYPGVGHVEIIGAFASTLRFLAPSLRDTAGFMRAPGIVAQEPG